MIYDAVVVAKSCMVAKKNDCIKETEFFRITKKLMHFDQSLVKV
jgi:hypothetical protein